MATHDEVQEHFADHNTTPVPPKKIGGTLTSIRAVRCRICADNRARLLERDDRRRIYRIEPTLVESPLRQEVTTS